MEMITFSGCNFERGSFSNIAALAGMLQLLDQFKNF